MKKWASFDLSPFDATIRVNRKTCTFHALNQTRFRDMNDVIEKWNSPEMEGTHEAQFNIITRMAARAHALC